MTDEQLDEYLNSCRLVGVVAASWRPLALFAGLVGCVVLAMAFWVVVQLAGGLAITALFAVAMKALLKI